MNKKLLSLFIILAILATYKCAHLKLQANLAQSQKEDFETQDFNFFQQKEEEQEEDYDPEDFDFISQQYQKFLEENNETEDFSLLQQDIEEENFENFEMEDFNLLQQQQQEQWQFENVTIAVDKFNVHNVFTQEELNKYEGYNKKILKENMRVFSKKYQDNMVPLLRLKKREGYDYKYVTVSKQQENFGYYWYRYYQGYGIDRVIGYVFDSSTYDELRRNRNFICLISLFNDGGVLPLKGLYRFIRENKSQDHLFSTICLPK